MSRPNRLALCLLLALFVAPLVLPGQMSFSMREPAPPPSPARVGEHTDDHGFPVGPTHKMPVFDPRWSTPTLFYSLIEDGNTKKVMVEGDLVLGTEEEVLRQSWSNAVGAAKQAVKQDVLMKKLLSDVSTEARDEVRRLADRRQEDMQKVGGKELRDEVQRAVAALSPLQVLRPSGDPRSDVERQAVAVFAGEYCQFRWANGEIPYEDRGVPHPDRLKEAIEHWQKRTERLIRFVKRDATNAKHSDYVCFERGTRDCQAYSIGRRPGLGAHRVTLADDCGTPQIIHEIGHVVGLFHEHCRTDRDKWIEIDPNNMNVNAKRQFATVGWKEGENLTPFDFESIMLYPYKAFAADVKGDPTIKIRQDAPNPGGVRVPKNPADFGLATGPFGGKTVGLSDLDVEGVKKMYRDKPCGPGR